MKLTKQLALEVANTLDLSFVEPGQDLDWNDVREIANHHTGGQLDYFQLGMLTDWAHKLGAERLSWRRRQRPASELLVL